LLQRSLHDFASQHIYKYVFGTKSLQLLVSLRFFNPRDDAYCIIWVKDKSFLSRKSREKAMPALSFADSLPQQRELIVQQFHKQLLLHINVNIYIYQLNNSWSTGRKEAGDVDLNQI